MKATRAILASAGLLLFCLAPFLAGCGGASTASTQSAVSKAANGTASFKITWPQRTRLIPLAANSINVVITEGNTKVANQLVIRPMNGGTSNVSFSTLPIGTLLVTASAYPSTDGTGVAQATASAPLTILPNQNTNFSLTMATTITHVAIAPIYPVWIGRSTTIAVAAYDANSNIVLTAPQNWTWKSSASGIASVTTGSATPTLTGNNLGPATLTATEGESGAFATAPVTVITPGIAVTPWVKFQGNQANTGAGTGTGAVGQLKWSFPTNGVIYASEAIGTDGTIYIGSSDNNLYALTPNGTQKWAFPTGGQVSCPVLGVDGTIYVGDTDSKVYAVNPDGTLKWTYTTGSAIFSNPAMASDGTVYACSFHGLVQALDGYTGSLKWTFNVNELIYGSPAVGPDGTIYIGCDALQANSKNPANLLYAITPSGSQKWTFGDEFGMDNSPTVGPDGTIYIGSNDNVMHAVDPTGHEIWFNLFSVGNHVPATAPALASDGTLYFGASNGNLYAINSNGTSKWSFTLGGPFASTPIIGGDGTIYIGYSDVTNNGQYYAVTPSGTQKWVYPSGPVNGASAIGSDGTVYLNSGQDLIALH